MNERFINNEQSNIWEINKMEPIQIIAIIFALFALSRATLRLKDKSINNLQFMFWGLIWTIVIVVAFIPNITSSISQIFGIGRGMDLVVYVSIALLFYLMFRLYIKMDKLDRNITKVVRKIALKKK